jgi:nicotinamidase-related amidase
MAKHEDLRPTDATLFRSSLLMDRLRSVLLIVDVQEKLFPQIQRHAMIQWNLERLVAAAKLLSIGVFASEQYPAGLGTTIEPLRSQLGPIAEKRMFSCRECVPILSGWLQGGVRQVLVAGIEAHVCVLQTALDLQSLGFDVFIPADAVGSRSDLDRDMALQRLTQAGVMVTTTESVLFEWCETSAIAEFKQISQLVRRTTPDA